MTKVNNEQSVEFLQVHYIVGKHKNQLSLDIGVSLNQYLLEASLGEEGAEAFAQWMDIHHGQDLRRTFEAIFVEYMKRTNAHQESKLGEE